MMTEPYDHRAGAIAWEKLTVSLRKEIDDLWVPRVRRAYAYGALAGACVMWAVLYFHWY